MTTLTQTANFQIAPTGDTADYDHLFGLPGGGIGVSSFTTADNTNETLKIYGSDGSLLHTIDARAVATSLGAYEVYSFLPLSNGNIAEIYYGTANPANGSATNLYFRVISQTGAALTGAVQINTATLADNGVNVSAVQLANGNIAFNWEQSGGITHATRVFTTAGTAVGVATTYDSQGDGNGGTEGYNSIAAGTDGSYIVEYYDQTDLRYSIFNADGSVRFSDKSALTSTTGTGKVIALDNGTYAYFIQDSGAQTVRFISPSSGNVTGAPVSTALSIINTGENQINWGVPFHSSNGTGFVIASQDSNYNVYLNYYNNSGLLLGQTTADGTGTTTAGGYSTLELVNGFSRGVIDEELHYGSGQNTTNRTIQTFDIPQPPTVTAGTIHISGATGNGGVYKIGDTVTATWNNSASGDDNGDNGLTVTGVTFNFSQFGGGSSVTGVDVSNIWTATYTITAGTIQASNRNVAVTASASGGTTTTTGTNNASVDDQAPAQPPTPTLAAASDSGASSSDHITNVTTPTITGTAESGATVKLYDTDGTTVLASGTATGGSYSLVSTALSEGAHSLTVKATDTAGNVGPASPALSITIDTTAPATPTTPTLPAASDSGASSSDGVTNVTTPTITGSAESGATVTLYDTNGTTVLGSGAATGGSYSIVSSTLGQGAHSLTVKATDTAGNTSAASSALSVTIDSTAPAQPPAPTLAAASDSGASNSDGITKVTTPTVSGTAESGSTVTLYDTNGVTVLGTAVATGGSYSITSSSLVDGSHSLTVKATDTAGNTSVASPSLSVTIDTLAPTVDSIARATGGANPNNASSETYTVTFSEPVSGVNANDFVSYAVTGAVSVSSLSVTAVSSTVYTVTANGVSGSGALRIDLKANSSDISDVAGNPSSAAHAGDQAYTVDQTAPSISGVTLDKASYKLGDTVTATIQLSGSYDNNGAYTLQSGSTLDGQALTAGSYDSANNRLTATFVASAGLTQVTGGTVADSIVVADAVGNASAAHATGVANTTIDTVVPAFSSAAVNGSSLVLTYTEAGSGLLTSGAAAGEFAVTVGGSTDTVTGATVNASAGTVTLALANAVTYGATTAVSYTPGGTASQRVQDVSGNYAASLSGQAVTNNSAAPSFSVGDVTVSEAAGTAVFTVTLTGATATSLSVNYATADGTAVSTPSSTPGTPDFTGKSGTLTFGASASGTQTQTVSVSLVNDNVHEATEAFYLNLSNATGGASIATAQGTGTITDDDAAPSLSINNVSAAEGNSGTTAFTFTVSLSAANGLTTQVNYATADGTALSPSDYTATSGTLTFSPGQTSKAVTVLVNGDTQSEPDETFYVSLSGATNATIATTQGTGTILNDDKPTTLVATLAISADTGASATDFVTRTAVQTVSGTLGASLVGGEYVEVSLDGGAHWTTATTSGTTFSLAGQTLLAGSNTLEARVSNAAGSGTAATQAYVLDTTAPAAPTGLADAAAGGGYVNAAHDTATQAVTGSAEAGATVAVYDGATLLGTTAANATTGAWSYTLGALAEGSHSLTATATDLAGNTGSPSSALAFTVDTTAPTVAITAPVAGDNTINRAEAAAGVTISGTSAGAEAGQTVTVTLLNAASAVVHAYTGAVGATGAWSVVVPSADGNALADGAYTLRADVTDKAGNPAATASQAVAVDLTPPTAPALALAHDTGVSATDRITSDPTIAYTPSAAGDTLLYAADGSAYATTAPAFAVNGSADGAHTVSVEERDPAGNIGPAASLTFTLDTRAPAAPTALADAAVAGGYVNAAHDTAAQTLTGSAEAGATVTVFDGATRLGAVQANATTGAWSYTLGVLGEGAHSLTAAATDTAGNAGAASAALAFTVDVTAPVVAITAPVAGDNTINRAEAAAGVAIAGTTSGAEAGQTVTVTLLDATNAVVRTYTGAVAAGGGWSVTVPAADAAALADGNYTVRADVADRAGNPAATALQPVAVDRTPPATPGLALTHDTGASASDRITSDPTLAYTAPAAGDTLLYAVDGQPYATALPTFATNGSADGVHTVAVEERDPAGNLSPAASLAFTLDTTAPAPPTGLADAAIVAGYVNAAQDTPSQTLTGVAEAGATVTVYDGAARLGAAQASTTGAWSYTVGVLASGSHSFTATATDVAGNAGLASSPLVLSVDLSAPSSPGTVAPQPTTSATYAVQLSNLERGAAGDPALSDPTSPLYAMQQAAKAIAAQVDAGQLGAADAQNALFHLVDGTTSVAEISYAFFTGKTPTAAGLNYLVHSSANPTDLNDAYYAQFSTENRYINFAANLGRFGDASTAAFHAAYDGLSLTDATAKAYAAIFGTTPTADKVSAILNSLVPDGRGGLETRALYFAYYGTDGVNGTGTKSAMIGWLLSDSVKEGFGSYEQADQHFLADLAHGTALFNVDLLAAYVQAPTLVGQPTTDATLGG